MGVASDEVVSALITALNEDDVKGVRINAATALGNVGARPPRAVKALSQAATDEDRHVAEVAIDALASILEARVRADGPAEAPEGAHMTSPKWATAMFKETTHDFGVLAQGTKVQHRFVVENIYVEDLRIASLKSASSRSSPRANKSLLKAHDKAEIIVEPETGQSAGRQEDTITVVFDRPVPVEIPLRVRWSVLDGQAAEPSGTDSKADQTSPRLEHPPSASTSIAQLHDCPMTRL
jgi:HEAT repeat protein